MILCLGEQFCVMRKGKAGGRATGAQHRSAPTDVMGQAGLTPGNLEWEAEVKAEKISFTFFSGRSLEFLW